MELFDNQTKKILGLDIGTNSIGASVIEIPKNFNDYGKYGKILWLGSRIIPTDAGYLNKFEQGQNAETKAAVRRKARSSRRLKFRYKLRRERLTKVFKILGWVPETFPFDNPKLIKLIIRNEGDFYFKMNDYLPYSQETYEEFYKEFGYNDKEIEKIIKKIFFKEQNEAILLPEDWMIYFLRKKALRKKISIQELVRILYLLNQRRGFKSSRKDLKKSSYLNYDEFLELKNNFKKEDYSENFVTRFVSITKVKSVTQVSEEKNKSGKYKFKIEVEDDRVYSWEVERKEMPNWEGKEYQLIVEQKLDENGKIKQTQPKIAEQDEWELVMLSLDSQIENSKKHVGEFFFDKIKEYHSKNEIFKIRQNVIKRERYIAELIEIWNNQVKIRELENKKNELLNKDKIEKIAETLYKHNFSKQNELKSKNLIEILVNDIIYFQRELKSQKNLIAECRYEKRIGIRKNENGQFIKTGKYGLKGAPVSSPYFQEFRIWQDIHNLKINPKDFSKKPDQNIVLDTKIKEKLFDLFNSQPEITSKNIFDLINSLRPDLNLNTENHQINLFKNRDKLIGNETKTFFRKIFRRYHWKENGETILNNPEKLERLWSILYCINSSDIDKSKKGIITALKKFFSEMPDILIEALSISEEFEKKYAAYSAMAIKKLLPLMRCGKYWNDDSLQNIEAKEKNLTTNLKNKIFKIIEQVKNNNINKELEPLKKFIKENKLESINDFQGLPTWVACYLVYGRHSESEDIQTYNIDQIKNLDTLKIIKQSKLVGNPLVKKVVLETLCLVRDICLKFGQPDEIHIELARELKKNNEEKRLITEANKKLKEEKEIVKQILKELKDANFSHYDENGNIITSPFTEKSKPNPNSNGDIELFRIYKNSGKFEWNSKQKKLDHDIEWEKLGKSPTKQQIETYILWLSQRCVSPYTGKIIPLSRLFNSNYYQKEHIIPRSKLKNDSFDNLVISETGINKAKDNELAANFIKKQNGTCEYGGIKYQLLKYEDYENLCKSIFKGKKLKNLLATEVPEDFISRQINDTRYIGRKLGELLKPFSTNENGIIFTIGSITNELKNNWGLNQVWNKILLPRFERLESIIKQPLIFKTDNEITFRMNGETLDVKRYDHRHHALDALIIAATTREHIRYLNTLNAANNNEEIRMIKRSLVKEKFRDFTLPWKSFVIDAKTSLEKIIPTFKVNKQIISTPQNKYTKYVQNLNGWEKVQIKQKSNPKWLAVRRSIFNENPLGIVLIKELKFVKVIDAIKIQIERMLCENNPSLRKTAAYIYEKDKREIIKLMICDGIKKSGFDISNTDELLKFIEKRILVTYKSGKGFQLSKYLSKNLDDNEVTEKILIAEFVRYKVKRVKIDKSFDDDKINKKIPYSQKSPFARTLINHLKNYNDSSSEAFSPEGLERLAQFNNGKPIKTIRTLDGELKDCENVYGKKYWETGNGAIAYSIIYENLISRKRDFESIPTHVVLKRILDNKPYFKEATNTRIITLQSGDLVYVPTDNEWQNIIDNQENPIDWSTYSEIVKRIYRFVKSINNQFYFLPLNVSTLIVSYDSKNKLGEFMSQGCSEYTIDNQILIKERCIKIKVDRLGNIIHYDL